MAPQSRPGRAPGRPPRPAGSSPLPAFSARPRGPGAPRLPPRPARPCGGAGVRALGAGPVPLPNVRAPHAQSAPAVSVCLNRKADILVPQGPPRPTPPGICRRDSPFPQPGPQRLPGAPPSAAAGAGLASSSPPALQPFLSSVCSGHRPRPAPPDTATAAPAATGQNGRVRLFRGDQLSAEKDRGVGPGRVAPGCAASQPTAPQSGAGRPVAQAAAAAAGTAPRPPFAFAFPLLPPLLPGGVSTLLVFLSPSCPSRDGEPSVGEAAGAR